MSLAASATRLIRRKGEPVVLTYVTGRVVDPATGEVTNPGTTVTIDGIYGHPGKFTASEVNGTSIQSSDTKLLLEQISTRPLVGWMATVASKTHRVMDVIPTRDYGTDAVYVCSLRAN